MDERASHYAPPDYSIEYETRAYDTGYDDGSNGRAIAHNSQLCRTFPNAYHRGYWDGVGQYDSDLKEVV